MVNRYWIGFFLVYSCLLRALDASDGDSDPVYRECLTQCEKTRCVKFSSSGVSIDGPWYTKQPLYSQWKHQNCQHDCQYHCMLDREKEREASGQSPVKYHGKWPFNRVYGIQEPLAVVFSVINLVMHFHGWLSLFVLLHYKLPLKQDKTVYYDYDSLWHIYGLLAMNFGFWSSVFHIRDVDLTKQLEYSSEVALVGYSLLVAILRSFNVTIEAARLTVAAPLLAFLTTHIMYLNFAELNYEWNTKVCIVLAIAQHITWAIWAGVTRHPSRLKLWIVVLGGILAMLLRVYDFPPYKRFIDTHALWHAANIPLAYIWWSFIRDDAEFRTSNFLKKAK